MKELEQIESSQTDRRVAFGELERENMQQELEKETQRLERALEQKNSISHKYELCEMELSNAREALAQSIAGAESIRRSAAIKLSRSRQKADAEVAASWQAHQEELEAYLSHLTGDTGQLIELLKDYSSEQILSLKRQFGAEMDTALQAKDLEIKQLEKAILEGEKEKAKLLLEMQQSTALREGLREAEAQAAAVREQATSTLASLRTDVGFLLEDFAKLTRSVNASSSLSSSSASVKGTAFTPRQRELLGAIQRRLEVLRLALRPDLPAAAEATFANSSAPGKGLGPEDLEDLFWEEAGAEHSSDDTDHSNDQSFEQPIGPKQELESRLVEMLKSERERCRQLMNEMPTSGDGISNGQLSALGKTGTSSDPDGDLHQTMVVLLRAVHSSMVELKRGT